MLATGLFDIMYNCGHQPKKREMGFGVVALSIAEAFGPQNVFSPRTTDWLDRVYLDFNSKTKRVFKVCRDSVGLQNSHYYQHLCWTPSRL